MRTENEDLYDDCTNVSLGNTIDTSKYGRRTCLDNICYTNRYRQNGNAILANSWQINKPNNEYHSVNFQLDSQSVDVCIGMPVIAGINDPSKKFVNNERYVVKQIQTLVKGNKKQTHVIKKINGKLSGQIRLGEVRLGLDGVDDSNDDIVVDLNTFEHCFKLAFYITCHSCQGDTYDRPYTIHEWDYYKMDESTKREYRYVALSRASRAELVNFI
jgi:hypothetical protein